MSNDDFTPEEKKFLDTHFKAGEYSILQLMVPHNQMEKLVDYLRKANLNMVILPNAQAKMDFATVEKKGKPQ